MALGELRPAPVGMPSADMAPPVIAESGDPFAALRVVDLVARLQRGRPIALSAIVDRLNATHVDWLFERASSPTHSSSSSRTGWPTTGTRAASWWMTAHPA